MYRKEKKIANWYLLGNGNDNINESEIFKRREEYNFLCYLYGINIMWVVKLLSYWIKVCLSF